MGARWAPRMEQGIPPTTNVSRALDAFVSGISATHLKARRREFEPAARAWSRTQKKPAGKKTSEADALLR